MLYRPDLAPLNYHPITAPRSKTMQISKVSVPIEMTKMNTKWVTIVSKVNNTSKMTKSNKIMYFQNEQNI